MPHDLPEGWAEGLADDEVGFLYEEARQQLRETVDLGTVQEAKAYALLSVSLILISASGIFGDLRVEATPAGVASVAAIVLSVVVVSLALWLLRVRRWEEGADVSYFARWALSGYVGARSMKNEVLEKVLVPGEHSNSRIVAGRDRVLRWLWAAVVLETACVVSVQAMVATS